MDERTLNSFCSDSTTSRDSQQRLTFSELYRRLADELPIEEPEPRGRRLARSVSTIAFVGGLAIAVWGGPSGSPYALHIAVIGFVIEILGVAGLLAMTRTWKQCTSTANPDDLVQYDRFHTAMARTVAWMGKFSDAEIDDLRATLDERTHLNEEVAKWFFGASEKLGLIPAFVALIAQLLTIVHTTTSLGKVVAGLIVGASIGVVAISLEVVRTRVRDYRIDWLLRQRLRQAQRWDPVD